MTESIYIKLFLDDLFFSSLLPLHQSWVFLVMNDFGLYNQNIMLIVALAGRISGSILNYIVGILFNFFTKTNKIYNKHHILLVTISVLLGSWINVIGSFVCFAGGYMRAKFLHILLGVFLSHGLYYLSLVMKL